MFRNSIHNLSQHVEKRNRLKLLQPWLEARAAESNKDPCLHNALGKIYIDSNQNADDFLNHNEYYDHLTLGKYCENRDPMLAFVAYQRGQCDMELVALTSRNGMYKQQARYLVKRQDPELWASVLTPENTEHRQMLVDQVVQTALPETTVPEEVSTTVKAFMTADMPEELTELLEKIILHGNSEFKNNRYLQNLLILTAIKADKTRVMDYINRLDNYDAQDIAKIAEGAELYEEAHVIYKKFGDNVQAIRVLLDDIGSIERGYEFAERVSEPAVWSNLAGAQMKAEMISEAVDSFMKAKDASRFTEVIAAAQEGNFYQDLVRYLVMARDESKVKEGAIDTELVYSYAKTNRLAELEEFISSPNVAQIQYIADRCFNEEMYEAAKILFTSISNYARLAVTLVRLQSFYAAVDAAQKANSIQTWKEVNCACIDAAEFRLAQMCALHIIVHADELEALIHFYESRGYFEELITLMKAGLGHERAHMGMFTELGILYAKYKPERLMEHIKLFHRRVNAHKMIRVCEQYHHWAETRFLYRHNDEFDNAIKVMMKHTAEAWDHEIFKDILTKVNSAELCYQSIHFYLEYAPGHLTDLMATMSSRVDNERVVHELRKAKQLPLGKAYLETTQESNLKGVNEALNEMYIDEEDFESLRMSIDNFDNFDQLALAEKLKKHELLEFRRIAAALYKKNRKWKQSVELSKKDKMYKDAMETVAESEDKDLAEELLRFFVDNSHHECFAACLYSCYELIRADIALELAWRHQIFDFVMPFLIQSFKEQIEVVEELKQKMEKKTEATAQPGMVDPGMGMNSLVPVGMNMPGMGMPGMGGPMGGMQGGMPGMGGPMGYAPQPTGW